MPKRKCVFGSELKQKYPFIHKNGSDTDVLCNKCRSEFSVANGGKVDIEKHINSEKHQKIVNAAASSKDIAQFFHLPSKMDTHIAACEGVWAFHTVCENHSFRSNDCSSQIIKRCFKLNTFSCARTKSEAIVCNVFAPFALKLLQEELEDTAFICLTTDASNHGNIKMFPVIVRFFNPKIGVRVKILGFSAEQGETGKMIFDLLKAVLTENNLLKKFICFCGDNANTNFGGIERNGEKNVFARLKEINKHLIGIGCAAHIVHNALRSACDQLPFDIECIVVKIYSYFYIYTVRTEKLKKFCETAGEEYHKLLGYSKTRFLALAGAINSIIKIFGPLKSYFLEADRPPKIIVDFLINPMAKLWLLFIHDQVVL